MIKIYLERYYIVNILASLFFARFPFGLFVSRGFLFSVFELFVDFIN